MIEIFSLETIEKWKMLISKRKKKQTFLFVNNNGSIYILKLTKETDKREGKVCGKCHTKESQR